MIDSSVESCDPSRIEVLAMHRLRAEDQVGERQREQRPNLGARPVVPHGAHHPARLPSTRSPSCLGRAGAQGYNLAALERKPSRESRSTDSPRTSSPRSRPRSLRRQLAESAREDGIWVVRDGRRLLSFSCNDYLNLTQHPAVTAAAVAAVERYGAGAGASRLVTGNHPLYAALEATARLAQGHRGGAASSARAISPMPASFRRSPAPTIWCWSTSWRMPACGPGRSWRAAASSPSATTTWRMPRSCSRPTAARHRSRADRHRRRVLDGRRPRAAAASRRSRRAVRRLAAGRRRARARRASAAGAARASRPAPPRACRCRWARCRRRSAAMAAISAPRKR